LRQPIVNHLKVPLADGLRSTLVVMRDLERKALGEKSFLVWIEKNFKTNCGQCVLKNVWQYMRNNFIFVNDNYDEVVISPVIMILNKKGDCDDFALFAHTILTALMLPSKYILLGAENNKPTHIAVYSGDKVLDGTNNKFNDIPLKYKYYSLV
jgi:hypothetical protein